MLGRAGDQDVRYPWCPCDDCRGITPEEIDALRRESWSAL